MARLIPARAGNTEKGVAVTSCFWAHPRSRGEHEHEFIPPEDGLGSSPLARGTLSLTPP